MRRVSYVVAKFHELLVHKRLKTGPEVLPTLTIYAIASGDLKWQYIAIIATFSSYYYYNYIYIHQGEGNAIDCVFFMSP